MVAWPVWFLQKQVVDLELMFKLVWFSLCTQGSGVIPRWLLSNTALPTLQRKMTVKNVGWERLHLERMERGGDHLGHVPGKWR